MATTNFDAVGNIASVVDPRGGTTGFTYDAKNRVTARQDPLSASDTFTGYDPDDNLLAATDRKGQAVAYAYDALNRPVSASYADGSVLNLTWDAGNRLTQIQDSAGGTIARSFDGLDRLTSETTGWGQAPRHRSPRTTGEGSVRSC